MSVFETTRLTTSAVKAESVKAAVDSLKKALESDSSLSFDRPCERVSNEYRFWLPDVYPVWDASWAMEDYMQLFLKRIDHNVDIASQLKLFVQQHAAAPMLVVDFANDCYIRLSIGKGLFGADSKEVDVSFHAKGRANDEIACQSFSLVAKTWNATGIMEYERGNQPVVRFPKKHAGLPLGDFSSRRHREGQAYPPGIAIADDWENSTSIIDCFRETVAALESQLGAPQMSSFVLQAMGAKNREEMVAHSLTISDKWDMEFYGQYAKGFSPFDALQNLSHPRIFPVLVAEFTDQTDGRFDQVLDLQISVRHHPDKPIDLLLHSSHNFDFMQRIACDAGLEIEQLPDRVPDGPKR